MPEVEKSSTPCTDAAIQFILDKNLHADVENMMNKKIISDEDIKKYNESKNTDLTVGDMLSLLDKAFSNAE